MDDKNEFRVELLVNFLYPGIILKGVAYTEDGEKIQEGGIPFTQVLIDQLKKKQVKRIYYTRKINPRKDPENPMLDPDKIDNAVEMGKALASAVENKKMLPEKALNTMVEGFIEDISKSEGTVLNLLELKDIDDYTYTHSINVCLISILFAKRLNYNAKGLKIIGAGALLHDIGKMLIPKDLLKKPSPLTEEEIAIIQKHPVYGYEYVKAQSSYGSLIQKIVLMHHERYNGKGYPFGIRGEEIGEIAQIIGLADTFDAITSESTFRQAKPYWYALIDIQKSSGRSFSPRLARSFVQDMPRFLTEGEIFPLGSFVVLSSGEVGEVIDYRFPQTLKPVVNVYINSKKEVVRYPIPIDLHFDDTRIIENVLEDEAIIKKMNDIKKTFQKREQKQSEKAIEAESMIQDSLAAAEATAPPSTSGIPEQVIENTQVKVDKDLFEEDESGLK